MARRRGRGNSGNATPGTRRKVAQARKLAPKHTSLESLAKAVGSSASTLSKHGVSAQGGMTAVGRMQDNKRGSAALTLDEPEAPIYDGYNDAGFTSFGKHRNGTKFDDDGYIDAGWNKYGYHRNGTRYNGDGYDWYGKHRDDERYNDTGFNKDGVHRNDTFRDDNGFNWAGVDADGYDRRGFKAGVHRNGTFRDAEGYTDAGFNDDGVHRNDTPYNDDGYDWHGNHRS